MRKIKEILKVIICLTLFSCDQKLDIEPAQSISVNKALSDENTVKNILIGTFILFSITFCKSKKRSKQTENAVSTSQIQLVKAPSSPDYLDSELNLSDINLTSTDSSYLVNFSFDVKNYELGVLTSDANDRDIANSEKGQHIHLILNNEPYSAHYDSFAQKNLS